MKCNAPIALHSSKVLLVPYSASHVPTYHVWMQDPNLQAATASEPLSLAEEFEMQRSWRTDGDKLTFIVCLPHEASNDEGLEDPSSLERTIEGGMADRPENMIGDVNLFLFEPDGDDAGGEEGDGDLGSTNPTEKTDMVVGELELMIARTDLQRKGYGRAALLVFVDYVLSHWDEIVTEFDEAKAPSKSESPRKLAYLRVKINASNVRSVRLFESLDFQQTAAGVNYFNEVELRWKPNVDALRDHRHWTSWRMLPYSEAQA